MRPRLSITLTARQVRSALQKVVKLPAQLFWRRPVPRQSPRKRISAAACSVCSMLCRVRVVCSSASSANPGQNLLAGQDGLASQVKHQDGQHGGRQQRVRGDNVMTRRDMEVSRPSPVQPSVTCVPGRPTAARSREKLAASASDREVPPAVDNARMNRRLQTDAGHRVEFCCSPPACIRCNYFRLPLVAASLDTAHGACHCIGTNSGLPARRRRTADGLFRSRQSPAAICRQLARLRSRVSSMSMARY